MTDAIPQESRAAAPLARRIRESEQRLLQHRAATALRVVAVGRALRDRVGVPLALVGAVGAGFFLGRLAGKRSTNEGDPPPVPAVRSAALIRMLLDALALVEMALALLPATRERAKRSRAEGNPAFAVDASAQPPPAHRLS